MKLPRPKTLSGWLIAVMLSALLVSQALAMLALIGERRIVAAATHRGETFNRVAGAVQFLMSRPTEGGLRSESILGSRTFRLVVAPRPQVDQAGLDERATQTLREILAASGVSDVRVTYTQPGAGPLGDRSGRTTDPSTTPPSEPSWQGSDTVVGETEGELLWVSVQLGPKRWLNVTAIPPPAPRFGLALLIAALLSVFGLTLAAWWAARRLTRPLQGLTAAADTVGRSAEFQPAPEEGPEDLRRVAREFNAMASRVRSMIEEQQLLLRAVGHDLRTPLSSLRIRLEFVQDLELRQKMVETIGEMEQLTSRALEAARGGAIDEPTRRIALGALVEAVCEDAAEIGKPVLLADIEEVDVHGRSSELRRAVQNLVENGVVHGGGATVRVAREGRDALVLVTDQGPGIPDADLPRVQEPFVRLDLSRTDEVPGHGLGLTIVAAVAQRHSGSLELENEPGGGLRATLRLPNAGPSQQRI